MPTGILPKGVIAPILTPFNDDLSIATDLYIDHAQSLLANGCVGLAPFGTTGEALSVGIDERIDAIKALIDSGIDPSQLIPGTGLTNFVDTARLSRSCIELGCAAVMVLPPFYIKNVSEQGLIDYFCRLIEQINHPELKIYLYHIPQVAGVGIAVNVVKALHRQYPDIIIGIKDSSGMWENTQTLLNIDSLIVYPGSELPLLEALAAGAQGCISATANINPAAIAQSIERYQSQSPQADSNHRQVKEFRTKIQSFEMICALKTWMALQTNETRWHNLRPPLVPLSKTEIEQLTQFYQKTCDKT